MIKGEGAIQRWEVNIKGWTTLLQTIGKHLAMERRKEENCLQEVLLGVELRLQNSPADEKKNEELVSIKNSLRRLQSHKIQGLKVRAKINWLNNGDKGSKKNFRFLKEKGVREKIDQINHNGTILNNQGDISKQFFMFFKDLFSSDGDSKEARNARRLIKRMIPPKISQEDSLFLAKEINKEEIKRALN